MIKADVILDSLSNEGVRLTTFLLTYPRFIHAELMTHRVFSRNASSSRAIPVEKLVADVRKNPATFVHWGRNQRGMQAAFELTGFSRWAVEQLWLLGMWIMTTLALLASRAGAHKQIVNRMIEPWAHITVVVTATDYANFMTLRHHPDAQPEIRALAVAMLAAFEESTPKELDDHEWHLPFFDHTTDGSALLDFLYQGKQATLPIKAVEENYMEHARMVSVARCARTSYKTFDGKRSSVKDDIALYTKLLASTPLHASPAEHQARPDTTHVLHVTVAETPDEAAVELKAWRNPSLHGNFRGFIQYRKTLPHENVTYFKAEGLCLVN
jgi:thymidylate synthase ThyX